MEKTQTRKKIGAESGAIEEGEANYLYGHDYEGGYTPQAYLPEGKVYYEPSEDGLEKRVAERLQYWREQFEKSQAD